ncbi:hypothetical protein [Rhodococcus sp. NPDC006774]|uniref:hypothetical protein n=1 Tax=Rhodococcus sp. NPDC006774 TaxID=3157186 RepID=UPI0033C61F9C
MTITMSTHDRCRPHPAAAIVHGRSAAHPLPTAADMGAVITSGLAGGLDVSLEIIPIAYTSGEVLILIGGSDAHRVAGAITAAPTQYGLARATLTEDLGHSHDPD